MATVYCLKLKEELEGLERAPFPGEIGKKILENISKRAWDSWLERQTMLINEYRLNPIDKKSREYLEEQMKEFLFSNPN